MLLKHETLQLEDISDWDDDIINNHSKTLRGERCSGREMLGTEGQRLNRINERIKQDKCEKVGL